MDEQGTKASLAHEPTNHAQHQCHKLEKDTKTLKEILKPQHNAQLLAEHGWTWKPGKIWQILHCRHLQAIHPMLDLVPAASPSALAPDTPGDGAQRHWQSKSNHMLRSIRLESISIKWSQIILNLTMRDLSRIWVTACFTFFSIAHNSVL